MEKRRHQLAHPARAAGRVALDALPPLLDFVKESGVDYLKEVATQQGKQVPGLKGFIGAAEKLADQAAQQRVEHALDRLTKMTTAGQGEMLGVREDLELISAMTLVIFATQREMQDWLQNHQPLIASAHVAELGMEAALDPICGLLSA
jgi:hypothetical protein